MKKLYLLLIVLSGSIHAQYNVDYFVEKAMQNSPVLKDYQNSVLSNNLQLNLNEAENSAIKVFLSADYLFAPYFNNNGKLISANPDPKAIGYDVGITNGGLYSAQLNVEKNIFNGRLLDALQNQNSVQTEQYNFIYKLEKHNLEKQITDQYLAAYKSFLLFELSKEIISNLTEQLNITSEQVEKGYEKAQNYLLLKIELQTELINSNEAYQTYKNDLTQLNSICGIKDTTEVVLGQVEVSLSLPKTNSDFLKKYNLDSLATINQQSLFETKYLPQFKLFLNTGLNAVEIDGMQRKFGMSAGLNFMLPILDGGQKSLTQQQNIITQKTISDYRKFSGINIELQKNSTSAKIESIKKNLDDLNVQINEYQKLMDISNKGLQKGDISMIEYLTLLKNFIDLRKSKIEKEINYQMEINNYNYWNW